MKCWHDLPGCYLWLGVTRGGRSSDTMITPLWQAGLPDEHHHQGECFLPALIFSPSPAQPQVAAR